jgi:hypothetical protein
MKLTGNTRRRIVLLAPRAAALPGARCRILPDRRYVSLIGDMQRLRGRLYLQDGAITAAQLTRDGRHVQDADSQAWHLLLVEDRDTVCGCARYLSHSPTVRFTHLGVSRSALAFSDRWGLPFRLAVEEELARARREGLAYVEVGGWALREDLRFGGDALRIAMASYGLAFLLGGCLGISTVTHRHCSAAILRRIGGRSLACGEVELPSYFDPAYGCRMEVLRFDSRQLNPRYLVMAKEIGACLEASPVLCPPFHSVTNDLLHVAMAVGMPSAATAVLEEQPR